MTPVEGIQLHLGDISEDVARSAEAQVEQAKATQTISEEIIGLREGQDDIRAKMGELSDEVGRMISLFGTYVQETQGLRAEAAKLLRAAPNGQR